MENLWKTIEKCVQKGVYKWINVIYNRCINERTNMNGNEWQLSNMAKALSDIAELMQDLNNTLSSIDDDLNDLNDKLDGVNDSLSSINERIENDK